MTPLHPHAQALQGTSLSDKITVVHANEQTEPEDFFQDSFSTIFPDETRNIHGDTGGTVVYKNSRFGNINLTLSEPDKVDDRALFAHYLWNSGIYVAEVVSEGYWDVKAEKVLELGAGVGLAGIISALCGAKQVTISDYPSTKLLENIIRNVRANLSEDRGLQNVTVQGHQWGHFDNDFSKSNKGSFTTVIAADCLWMPEQHQNLVASINHFLSDDLAACAYIVAGFHTGRAKVAMFFDAIKQTHLYIDDICEVDVRGTVREWEIDRSHENVTERKRWLVVAVLKRPSLEPDAS